MPFKLLAAATLTLLATALSGAAPMAATGSFTVFAMGLNNPRGLSFGENGVLYVAEGGTGGTLTTTPDQCKQVPPPVGPYSGGKTGRISKVSRHGVVTTVASNLPSSQTQPPMPGALPFVSGIADVAFIDDTLYALTAGAGCSHGLAGTVNEVLRVSRNGTTHPVANLSTFLMQHPVVNPEPADFEQDGTWYSMVPVHNKLYAVEPNHGEVDVVNPHGGIRRLVDVSATYGHIVPTAITFHHGNFYLGNLNRFDAADFGHSRIFKLTPRGQLSVVTDSLTAVTGVAFHGGHLYALQAFTTPPLSPGTGSVVRLNDRGSWDTVADGLTFPTAMKFGPDGKLYVSNFGFGFGPGAGQIVKIPVPDVGNDD